MIIIAVANQKGGSAKTTTGYHLATDLARRGHAVLFFDNDAQGNATTWLGAEQPGNDYCDIVDFMIDDRVPLEDITQSCKVEHITLVPSTRDMQGADFQIMDAMIQGGFQPPSDVQGNLDMLLSRRLRSIPVDWDFCIIDTPPSMGMVTRNSLIAADCLIIPVDVSHMGFEGTGSMLSFLTSLGEKNGKKIRILGVVATILESQTRLGASILNNMHSYFVELLFGAKIRKAVKLREASAVQMPLYDYAPDDPAALDYEKFCDEALARLACQGFTIPAPRFPAKPSLQSILEAKAARSALQQNKLAKRKKPSLRREAPLGEPAQNQVATPVPA